MAGLAVPESQATTFLSSKRQILLNPSLGNEAPFKRQEREGILGMTAERGLLSPLDPAVDDSKSF